MLFSLARASRAWSTGAAVRERAAMPLHALCALRGALLAAVQRPGFWRRAGTWDICLLICKYLHAQRFLQAPRSYLDFEREWLIEECLNTASSSSAPGN